MGRRSLRRATLALLLAGLAACGGESSAPGPARPRTAPPPEATLDDLAALGYADFADEPAEGGAGVVLHDTSRTRPGYNLCASIPDRTVTLFDMEGRVVRSWAARGGDPQRRWNRAALTRDGGLLVIDSDRAFPTGAPGAETQHSSLLKLDRDGQELWRRDVNAHHYLEELPDGRIVTLTATVRDLPAISRATPVLDNAVVVLTPEGEPLEEHSVHDLLASNPALYVVDPPGLPARGGGEGALDVFHVNSARWTDDGARWLLTCRNLNLVALVDRATGTLEAVWGPGELQGPHEAVRLANGNVLVLDNGWRRRDFSRVLEVDLASGAIVWSWTATPPESFFTTGRGIVQPLPDGNVLVASSAQGRAFEVTRAGDVVWEYRNPLTDPKGRPSVLRLHRYEPTFVEALLR